ncbi:type II CRISPR RNA-guided endonuclease Cas9 [Nitratireductor sp. GISD-1A_MAKvit]|uniref:type II CRISPR RNA-guided endonuclease Cas9 n=1 Tax=Nitratireductor sp. GISD-1A_MAKvit TaxID=3234198 RepID=UPI003466F7D7
MENAISSALSGEALPRDRQTDIVENLLAEPDEDILVTWLMEEFGLEEKAATAAGSVRLPQGHGHIGRSLLSDIVKEMESGSLETEDPLTGEIYLRPLTYDEAVARLDLHHSDLKAGCFARLPYYGEAMARHVISNPDAPESSQERIGRVPNPTVHIALNQMRTVVNALIETYGKPAKIHIELARELKQNHRQKQEAIRRNRENEAANQRRNEELRTLGFADTYSNRLLLRLYEELPADERVCVYSGTPISKEMLFSGAVDIDHILPRSKTLDDSFANKVLCTREMNRIKGNRSPADVWTGDRLQDVVERAWRLFPRKAWRFQPDALDKFTSGGDFIARHLTDSQHIARLAKEYLGHLYGEDRNRRVFAIPGRLTAMLRAMWGLNGLLGDHNRAIADGELAKSRDDHRHHAVDAFVIACTNRAILQRVATAVGRAEAFNLGRWAEKGEFPEPFEGYRVTLRDRLDMMVISHKPDHGLPPGASGNSHVTSGQLHEETAYGAVHEEIRGKIMNLVTRKPIAALSEREIGQVRDLKLREALEEVAYDAKRDGIRLTDALANFGEQNGIRRVRVLKTEKYTINLSHGKGRFHKTYVPGANHCIEIFSTPEGKWCGEGVSVFDANRKDFTPAWRVQSNDARLVMRLHKGDTIEANFGDGRRYYVVRKLSPANNRIEFVPHLYAGKLGPGDYMQAAFSKLQKAGARLVRVDPIGRIIPVGRG